ncbi:MAG: SLC13 family permease [Gammaproteobacteria bacterium]|nr:SLC13 family permease [Gammaproteobacteria bacterium]
MTADGWLALVIIFAAVLLLAITSFGAELVLMGALSLLLLLGVIPTDVALAGFSNEGLATIAVLYVVTAGLRETGSVNLLGSRLLTRPASLRKAQLRLMIPTALLSAFVNNTPVVAMLIPAVRDWAKRFNLPVGQLLMPLSFAAILGGSCTLIGTSTNLVLNGMLITHTGESLGLFDIALIGIPVAIVVMVALVLLAPVLLPRDGHDMVNLDNVRSYIVEMLVEHGSGLEGKTIEAAGLRHLPGLYLVEIERGGVTLSAVMPGERLLGGDRLMFAGVVESVSDLQRFDGLRLAEDHVFKLNTERSSHLLMEAVVSEACPLVGKSIREGGFRNLYNAAVIAVSRNGRHVHEKPGDIVLQSGDLLLLEAHADFARHHRNSRDFLLINQIEDSQPYRANRRWVAMGIFFLMMGLVVTGVLPLFEAALLAAGALVISGCTSAGSARREINWQVLIIIGASIGLGKTLLATGVAEVLANNLLAGIGNDPWLVLTFLFLFTAALTAMVSNVAAATLMFPLVISISELTGLRLYPLLLCLMMASSASFMTPIGYQTNLMVYGPGGYRFNDFLKIGTPLTLLACLVTVVICGFMLSGTN